MKHSDPSHFGLSRAALTEKVREVVADHLGIAVEKVTLHMLLRKELHAQEKPGLLFVRLLRDAQEDNLSIVEMVGELEAILGIDVADFKTKDCKTVNDLVNLIASRGAARER